MQSELLWLIEKKLQKKPAENFEASCLANLSMDDCELTVTSASKALPAFRTQ